MPRETVGLAEIAEGGRHRCLPREVGRRRAQPIRLSCRGRVFRFAIRGRSRAPSHRRDALAGNAVPTSKHRREPTRRRGFDQARSDLVEEHLPSRRRNPRSAPGTVLLRRLGQPLSLGMRQRKRQQEPSKTRPSIGLEASTASPSTYHPPAGSIDTASAKSLKVASRS